ncbi:MAG: ATP-binding protein [Defluviitaleaceae bacterium]|nr:ATP-binding protein [Defluviitaleaceae bacterium]
MLVEFSVENFRSFKDKVTFSMLASEVTEHEDTNVTTLDDGTRLLKSAVIYGANASGKSNLMLAMAYMSDFVYRSYYMQPDEPTKVIPFKLDADCKEKPSKFEVIFYCDGIKYAYGFAVTNKEVPEEYLYTFKSETDELQMLFSRDATNEKEYDFPDGEDKGLLENLCQFNARNKLYLSTAALLNYKKITNIYNWMCDFTLQIYNFIQTFNTSYNILRDAAYYDKNADVAKSVPIVNKAIEWVKEIDTGISEVTVVQNPDSFDDDFFNNTTMEKYIKLLNNFKTMREIMNSDGSRSKFEFKFFDDESLGTSNFFTIAIAVAEKMSYGGIILADELNAELHVFWTKRIVSFFHDAKNNPLHSQLIFTTHDTGLLDLDLFRRDQIWFTEKSPDTSATDIFSLYDFGDKTDVDVKKGYLLGVYGAIPFIRGGSNV